jgi:hypothetical protein
LPAVAVYAGGVDGGDWVACEGEPDGALHCRIFDPEGGALRRESWFRYCPQNGSEHVGSPDMLDAVGLYISRATLIRDRRDVFHPPANATAQQVQAEQQLIEESYREYGVDRDCRRMSASRRS